MAEDETFAGPLWWNFITAIIVEYGDISSATNVGGILVSILKLVEQILKVYKCSTSFLK